MTENDYPVDLSEITQVIRTADVMLIRFTMFDKRLLVDARYDGEEGPLAKIVPRAGSAAERFRSLKQLRPRFPLPKNIVSFTWPMYISSLQRLGVWQVIVERFQSSGFDDAGRGCQDVLAELLVEEQRQIVSAITGEGYETLWERKKDGKPE